MKKLITLSFITSSLLASGVWFQAEHTALREVMGIAEKYKTSNSNKKNFNRLWDITKPVDQAQVVYGPTEGFYFRPIYMAGNGSSGVPACKKSAYEAGVCVNKISGCVKINGKELCNVIGTQDNKKRIQTWEDIYFSMALLRDKTQIPNLSVPADINNGANAAEIGPFWHDAFTNSGYLDDLIGYYGLQPYYTNAGTNKYLKAELGWGGSGTGTDINNKQVKITRYDISSDRWKRYVSVKAYIENTQNSNNFIALGSTIKPYGFEKILPRPGTYSNNLLSGRYAPEVVGTDNSTYALRSSANFTVKTMKHCTQRVLYEIKVKRVVIPGKYRDFTIYDANKFNNATDKCKKKSNLAKTDAGFNINDTWWGYYDDISKETCTSDNRWMSEGINNKWSDVLKDYTHDVAPVFKFYVIQEGDPNGDDCLNETTQADITSTFVNDINVDKINFSPIKAKDIYTYIEGEDAFIKFDFSKSVVKTNPNPFDDNNTKFISINTNGNNNYDYYIQKNCVNFDNINCKYEKIPYKENPTDLEIEKGKVGFNYKSYCQYMKRKDSQFVCGENKHSNEIFYRYSNSVINFKNIQASKNDWGRRNFKVKYYPTIDDTERKEIPHTPISVRPKYIEVAQELCNVAQNCDKPLRINVSGSKETITNNNLYINKYALKIDYPGDSLNPKQDYYIDLAYNNAKINSLVEVNTKNPNNNFKPIVLFDAPSITSIIVKDLHIKKYFDDLKKNYTDYCTDTYDTIINLHDANTRDSNGKIACSTPVKNSITAKSTTNININYKDNVDKDARTNVVLTNHNKSSTFTYGYNFYPQISVKSYNDYAVAKYFTDDIKIDFDPKFSRNNIQVSDFMITKNIGADIINNITTNSTNFSVSISKDKLNDIFVNTIKTLSASNKTTLDLLNEDNSQAYTQKERYKAQKDDTQTKKIFELNNNAYEIPLKINYTKISPLFTLDSMKTTIKSNKDFASDLINQQNNIEVKFASATPSFKDVSVKNTNKAILEANWDENNTKLRYLSSNSGWKDFVYDEKSTGDWSSDCNVKPCFDKNIINNTSVELPGFDAEFISDYGLEITKTPRKIIIKNTKVKNTSYIKDVIRCYGGIFNCDTTFTVEFKYDK